MPTQEEIDLERARLERESQQAAAAEISARLGEKADREIVYDETGSPRVTLRIAGGRGRSKPYFCVVEVDGILPYRSTTAEERVVAGILSLNPPSVKASSAEKLVINASRAVQSAIFATPGNEELTPGDFCMIHYRTTHAVRAALRQLGEDV